MLNIGRMGAGSQRYYLDHVARSVDDYYLGRGEAAGRWLGRGLDGVGLEAGTVVTSQQLGAVLAAVHPVRGAPLSSHSARTVPGFDLTFRAPKSVSLMWGLAGGQEAAAAEQAHRTAVAGAVDYLERTAGRTRRGAQGRESVRIDGFVAAAFEHRTSRDGDPLLHTHVLVANLARTVDDAVFRTLDSRRLYAHARTAGSVYQAVLRHELTDRLGVRWGPVVNGTADVEGLPRRWIEAFSKRRAAIVAELDRRGESSAAAAQVATLDTRRAKPVQPDTATLRDRWRAEGRRIGMVDGWWHPLLHLASPRPPDRAALYAELVTHEALTAQSSSFAVRDVVQAIADGLRGGAAPEDLGATVSHVLTRGLDSGALVRLGDGTSGSGRDLRMTTRQLLELERAAVAGAVWARDAGLATAQVAAFTAAVSRRPSLSSEQVEMVRRLTTDGSGVAVVVGRAGTGKTFALDAARSVWEAAGCSVSGTALAARAATELQDAAGVPSTTLARLLRKLDERGTSPPWDAGRHVLVVDEAGMVGTRQLARLLDRAATDRVKVVLVGDPHQLPEIEAGGLYGALARALPAVQLQTNRRQAETWEVDALDRLRSGDAEVALASYEEHGRVVTADTAEALRERLVGDWWQQATGPDASPSGSVMIALRQADVDDLNRRARARMAAQGWLHGPSRELPDGTDLREGDRIVCLRNDRRLGVVNGTRGTVAAIARSGSVAITTDVGRRVHLPGHYLDAGHVTHGYAITGHKAQGLTVDHTFVLGSQALYREWGYVAMSRGRRTNRLYLHEAAGSCLQHERDEVGRREALGAAVRRLTRSAAEPPLTELERSTGAGIGLDGP